MCIAIRTIVDTAASNARRPVLALNAIVLPTLVKSVAVTAAATVTAHADATLDTRVQTAHRANVSMVAEMLQALSGAIVKTMAFAFVTQVASDKTARAPRTAQPMVERV